MLTPMRGPSSDRLHGHTPDMTVVESNGRTTRVGGVTGKGFLPGQSANPGGRPRGLARRVREIVGADGEQLAIFLRGWGKPVVSVDLEMGVETRQMTVDTDMLAELSNQELEVLADLAGRGYLTLSTGSR